MPVLKVSTDSLQTYFGLGQAVVVAVADFAAHLGPDGLNYQSPVFWIGMAYAVISAVKGYYAAGVKAEVKPAEAGEQKVDVVVPKDEAVKALSVLILGLSLFGCAATQGTMLDGRLCTIASSDAAQQDVKTIVDSYVDPNDKAKADLYLSTAKLSATALCEAARARQAVIAQGNQS